MPDSEDRTAWESRARRACWLWDFFHVLWWAVPAVLAFVNVRLAHLGQLSAGFLVISILLAVIVAALFHPRSLPPLPAGLLLPEDEFPELYREFRGVARSVGHVPPEAVLVFPGGDIFLTPQPRRSDAVRLYVGVALLAHASRGELKALAAQEFLRFGFAQKPASSRVVRLRQFAVAQMGLRDDLIHHLYLRFISFFLEFTHGIARRHELDADVQCARQFGGESLVSGLRRWVVLRPAFESFWNMELAPVLDAGFKPPILAGFSSYMESAPVREIARELVARELRELDEAEAQLPPPLGERIRAVQVYVSSGPPNDTAPAAGWLPMPVGELEPGLLSAVFPNDPGGLAPIGWEDVLPRVLGPQYRQAAMDHAEDLAGIGIDELPAAARVPGRLLERILKGPMPPDAADDELRMLLGSMLGPVLGAIVHARGVHLDCRPGEPVRALSDPVPFLPFSFFADVHAGRLSPEDWDRICRNLNLQGRDLGELCRELETVPEPKTGAGGASGQGLAAPAEDAP